MAKLPDVQAMRTLPTGPAGARASSVQIADISLPDAAINILGKIKEDNDNSAVEEAYNKLLMKQDELRFGEEKGYETKLKSGAAVNNPKWQEEYIAYREKEKEAIAKNLTGEQAERFNARAAAAERQYRLGMLSWNVQQSNAYKTETIEGTYAYEAEVGARNFANSSEVMRSRQRVEANIIDELDHLGYTDPNSPAAQALRTKRLSQWHIDQVEAMITAEQPEMAEAKLTLAFKQKEISEDQYNAYKSKVKAQGNLLEAQTAADELWEQWGNTDNLTGMLADARKNYSGELEKEVISELKTRFQERNAQKNLVSERIAADMIGYIKENGITSWTQIPTEQLSHLAAFAPDQYANVINTLERQVQVQRKGVTTDLDPVVKDLDRKEEMGVLTLAEIDKHEQQGDLTTKKAKTYRDSIAKETQQLNASLKTYWTRIAGNKGSDPELLEFQQWANDYATFQGPAPAAQLYNIWKMEGVRKTFVGVGSRDSEQISRFKAKKQGVDFYVTPPEVHPETRRPVAVPFDKAIQISRNAAYYESKGVPQQQIVEREYAEVGGLALMELNRMHGYEVGGFETRGGTIPPTVIDSTDPYQIAATMQLIKDRKPVTPKNIAIWSQGVRTDEQANKPRGQ